MLSQLAADVPVGEGWLYEPKWDGFRALCFRDGEKVELISRKGQPLSRYFPELLTSLSQALPEQCVVDGEIILAGKTGLDFDALQQRIHPAASRVARLAQETPTQFVAFDFLALGADDLRERPLVERRILLAKHLRTHPMVHLCPQTTDPEVARTWFVRFEGAGLDGVVAKRADQRYRPGERVMVKVKHGRTADCVLGGYRTGKTPGVASLLLGLYDDQGVLHYVGHTSSFSAAERRRLLDELRPLEGGKSFGEGRAPGGPSRWSGSRDTSYVSLSPERVCEVGFDYLQGDRFRHAARFLRWRSDKDPRSCDFAQLRPPHPFELSAVFSASS